MAILIALVWAVPSLAVETSRDEYVEAVEPICRANTEANEKILAGVRSKVRSGTLNAAARQFASAARALSGPATNCSRCRSRRRTPRS